MYINKQSKQSKLARNSKKFFNSCFLYLAYTVWAFPAHGYGLMRSRDPSRSSKKTPQIQGVRTHTDAPAIVSSRLSIFFWAQVTQGAGSQLSDLRYKSTGRRGHGRRAASNPKMGTTTKVSLSAKMKCPR